MSSADNCLQLNCESRVPCCNSERTRLFSCSACSLFAEDTSSLFHFSVLFCLFLLFPCNNNFLDLIIHDCFCYWSAVPEHSRVQANGATI